MSPRRSLLAAGGLTGLVIIAVLIVGARQGAFGLSEPEAVALTADGTGTAEAVPAAGDVLQRLRWDDDDNDDEEEEDDPEGEDDDDDRPARRAGADGRSGDRTPGRARRDAD
jgi:hypothetical protein